MRIDAVLEITEDELAALHASRQRRGLPRTSCAAITGKLPPDQRCWWVKELVILANLAAAHRPEHAESLRARAKTLAHATLSDWPVEDIESGIAAVRVALAGRGKDPHSLGRILSDAEEKVLPHFGALYIEHDRFPTPAEVKALAASCGVILSWGTVSRFYQRLNLDPRAIRKESLATSSINEDKE